MHVFIFNSSKISESATLVAGAAMLPLKSGLALPVTPAPPLDEFGYSEITLASGPHLEQLQHCVSVLMGLSEDSLLKPMRQMAGSPRRSGFGRLVQLRSRLRLSHF